MRLNITTLKAKRCNSAVQNLSWASKHAVLLSFLLLCLITEIILAAPVETEPRDGMILAVPARVTVVNATSNSCSNVVVTWTDVTGETGYYIYRDGTQVGKVGANVTTYTDTPSAGTCSYRVAAYNASCTGTQSDCRLHLHPQTIH